MKIFFISEDIPFKGFSGSSIISWSWINYFLKKNHKISIFIYPSRVMNFNSFEIKQLEELKKFKNLEIYFFKKQNLKKSLSIFRPSLKRYLNISDESAIYNELKMRIDTFEPDVLFLYGLFSMYVTRKIQNIKKFAPMCENPYRISLAKLKYQSNYKNFIFRLYDLYRSWFLMSNISNIYNLCDLKGHSSEDFRKDFLERGVKNIKYYNHPFPMVKTKVDNPNLLNSKIIMLVVGALSTVNWTQYKIISKYIINKISFKNKLDIEVRIVGAKKNKYFKKLYDSKYVTWTGYVDDIKKEFETCDIFLSLTPIELGLRVRLIEAMAYGKCIVVSKFDQQAFPLLKHNHNCYVIKNNDVILDTLSYLIDDSELRKKLSNQARNDFLDYCREDISCSIYEKDIANLIKENILNSDVKN